MSHTINNYKLRVFYEDTDAGGVVYHANYLKYFERARTEWLRELGIKQSSFLEKKLGFVIRKVEMDYLASAMLDDELLITSEITELKRATLVFNQQVTNQKQKVICIAKVKVAFVDFTLAKPCAFPELILGALKRVC